MRAVDVSDCRIGSGDELVPDVARLAKVGAQQCDATV